RGSKSPVRGRSTQRQPRPTGRMAPRCAIRVPDRRGPTYLGQTWGRVRVLAAEERTNKVQGETVARDGRAVCGLADRRPRNVNSGGILTYAFEAEAGSRSPWKRRVRLRRPG